MPHDHLLDVSDLTIQYNIEGNLVPVVDRVSFYIDQGEIIGLVGESGCGKTQIALSQARLLPKAAFISQSSINDVHSAMIFQDPLASLNPRMTIGEIIAEPLKTHYPKTSKADIKARVGDVMNKVGLLENLINRYPHEFSGGQCQRIGIARALILKPKLIICDEPVSALDVSIQAQVINLLMDLQKEMGLTLIFIAHDLSIVKHISTKIMVLYMGNIVELAKSEDIYNHPRHPYTQALISAVPIPDPIIEKNKDLILIEGDLPSPINPPSGCVFRTRCKKAQDICSQEKPELKKATSSHEVACNFND